MIRILQSDQVGRLLARKAARFGAAEAVVRPILEAVRKRGDRALLEYARRFDSLERASVRVPEKELSAAAKRLTPEFRAAVETASGNIRAYALRQMPKAWTAEVAPGLCLGQIVRPLDTVAAYIPAGRYPLPSTLMMTAVPAQVAGVSNICVACPKPVAQVFGTAEILGLNQSMSALARILGPACGGFLFFAEPSHVLPYIAGAALMAVVLVLTLRLRPQ